MEKRKIRYLTDFFKECHERLIGSNKRQVYSEIERIKRDYDLQGCGLFPQFIGKQLCLHLTPPQNNGGRIYSSYALYKFTKRGEIKPTISKHPFKHHSRLFLGRKVYKILTIKHLIDFIQEVNDEKRKSI